MTETAIAYSPDGKAEFQFDLEAAADVCSSRFADGTNMHPGGRSTLLLRTAKGRWVWCHASQWQNEPTYREAAVNAEGVPYSQHEVEQFIARYGSDEDLLLWRTDIDQPLPLA